MKDYIRRAIVYIAGRLISSNNASVVYDYSVFKYFNFSGDISPTGISIYDCGQKCHITGSGASHSYLLYHYRNGKYINLDINGSEFHGYDYDSGKHFSITVSGNSVSLNDYEYSKYFNYAI